MGGRRQSVKRNKRKNRNKRSHENATDQEPTDGETALAIEKKPRGDADATPGSNERKKGQNELTPQKKTVEWLSFVALAIYCGLTAMLWWTSREGIHSGQRAYLIVKKVKLAVPLEVGKPIQATYEIQNTGQTPAQNVTVTSILDLYSGTPPPAEHLGPPGTVDIGAGQVQPMAIARINPLTAEEARDVSEKQGDLFSAITKNRRLFIYGLISYTDVFGGRDETEFCVAYTPSMRTPDYNDFMSCTSPTRNRIH